VGYQRRVLPCQIDRASCKTVIASLKHASFCSTTSAMLILFSVVTVAYNDSSVNRQGDGAETMIDVYDCSTVNSLEPNVMVIGRFDEEFMRRSLQYVRLRCG